jgi:hypothetical protein
MSLGGDPLLHPQTFSPFWWPTPARDAILGTGTVQPSRTRLGQARRFERCRLLTLRSSRGRSVSAVAARWLVVGSLEVADRTPSGRRRHAHVAQKHAHGRPPTPARWARSLDRGRCRASIHAMNTVGHRMGSIIRLSPYGVTPCTDGLYSVYIGAHAASHADFRGLTWRAKCTMLQAYFIHG